MKQTVNLFHQQALILKISAFEIGAGTVLYETPDSIQSCTGKQLVNKIFYSNQIRM